MDMSAAERQRRWAQRLKDKAAATVSPDEREALTVQIAALNAQITALTIERATLKAMALARAAAAARLAGAAGLAQHTITPDRADQGEIAALLSENVALKAEIAALKLILPEGPHGHARARAGAATKGEPLVGADQVRLNARHRGHDGEHERAAVIDADDADRRMHAKQLFRRPPEPVRFSSMPIDEVERIGPNTSPCVRPEAGTRVMVGGEGEEGVAPSHRCRRNRSKGSNRSRGRA